MVALEELLERPSAPVDPEVVAAIDAGPIEPDDALSFNAKSRLFEPGYLPVETGYCTFADGRGYVAVLTQMPGVTAEMLDWWFDWHPRDPLRYRIWFPQAHFENYADPPSRPGAKPFYNTVHHPVEDIGLGRDHIRIEFVNPVEFGLVAELFPGDRSATIICGTAGDDRRHVNHTKMCHFARETPEGIELRSRFWIGEQIEYVGRRRVLTMGGTHTFVTAILNSRAVRKVAVPKRAPEALARHCAQEYANLAALLPELWRDYGG